MSTRDFEGKEVVISYDATRCIHAGECVRGAPAVFDPEARPWIAPDRADGEQIAQVIRRCPTGALTLRFRDGRVAEMPDALATIALAVLIAAIGVYSGLGRVRPVLERPLHIVRRLHSGHVGDYVAWLLFGVAALGALFALT